MSKKSEIYMSQTQVQAKTIKKRKKRRKIILIGCISLLFLFIIARRLKKKVVKPVSSAIRVRVIEAESKNVKQIIKVNGEIKAKFAATIFSDVSGRVRAVLKREGNWVAKGTPLILIDRRATGVDYLDFIVRSPINGVVGRNDAEVGHTIGPSTQLMKIVNPRFMECVVNLVERDIGAVKVGMTADVFVDSYTNSFRGTITEVSNIVNPISRTIQVKVLIDNKNYPRTPLKDGMYATANLIINERKNVPVIPFSAVLDNRGEKYIFVIKKKNKIIVEKRAGRKIKKKRTFYISEKRIVSPGILKRVKTGTDLFVDYVEIKKGLKKGEIVIFMGHRFLMDNTEIDIRDNLGKKIKKYAERVTVLNSNQSSVNTPREQNQSNTRAAVNAGTVRGSHSVQTPSNNRNAASSPQSQGGNR